MVRLHSGWRGRQGDGEVSENRVTQEIQHGALEDVMIAGIQRGEKHGLAPYDRHKTLGVITEEYHELISACREDTDDYWVESELIDIAVACVYGIASLRTIKAQNELSGDDDT